MRLFITLFLPCTPTGELGRRDLVTLLPVMSPVRATFLSAPLVLWICARSHPPSLLFSLLFVLESRATLSFLPSRHEIQPWVLGIRTYITLTELPLPPLSLSFLSELRIADFSAWNYVLNLRAFVKNKFLSLLIIFSVFLDLLTYRWMFDNFVFRFFINHFFKSKLKNFHYWNQSDSSKRIETWEKFLRVFDIKDIFKLRNSRFSVRRIVYTPLYHES